MKKLKIICWFADSEKFVSEVIIKFAFKNDVLIRKIIDPYQCRIQYNVKSEYEFYGYSEDIDKIKTFFEIGDFDVTVEEES